MRFPRAHTLAIAALLGGLPVLMLAQAPPPVKIPVCTGLTLVTAVNDSGGDYESIKSFVSADDKEVRLAYSTQKMDYGDIFSTDPPKLKMYETKRVVLREDMRTSHSYLQQFDTVIPEAVPGMTAVGVSTAVLNELKTKGETDMGISFWVFVNPPGLDRDDYQGIYKKQMVGKAKLIDRGTLSVLVNGRPVDLPFVHVGGNFIGYQSELWFLDQPDNPLTLKYRIGLNEIAPLTPDQLTNCAQWLKHAGYNQQHCTRPKGGDRFTLDLVKINYQCGAAALPPGAGSGAGAGVGGGAGLGAARGGGAGAGAGPGMGDLAGSGGAPEMEAALSKDSRVEIFDIFFSLDSDEIRKESDPRLKDIAAVLKKHPDWKLKVEGHTDSLAADDYNLKLSQRRAAAVKTALVSRYGIDGARLVPEGLGETKPRASNDTLAGRARNRRVELVRIP
jgi:outer membrane protein OmpA-like peptidoglycan-associated protein